MDGVTWALHGPCMALHGHMVTWTLHGRGHMVTWALRFSWLDKHSCLSDRSQLLAVARGPCGSLAVTRGPCGPLAVAHGPWPMWAIGCGT
jgi:hypothetical protein